MDFASRLKKYRKGRGLTQVQLAEKAGVSRDSIINYENGRRVNPPISVITKLSDALEVDPGELVAGWPGLHIIGVNETEPQPGKVVPSASSDDLNIPDKVKHDPNYHRTIIAFNKANEEGQSLIAEVAEAIASRPTLQGE